MDKKHSKMVKELKEARDSAKLFKNLSGQALDIIETYEDWGKKHGVPEVQFTFLGSDGKPIDGDGLLPPVDHGNGGQGSSKRQRKEEKDKQPETTKRRRVKVTVGGGGDPSDPSSSSSSESSESNDFNAYQRWKAKKKSPRKKWSSGEPAGPARIDVKIDAMLKPDKFTGKPKQFRPWWDKVSDYLEYHESGFPSDQVKLLFLPSLLKEEAEQWWSRRRDIIRQSGKKDSWKEFVRDMKAQFTNPYEKQDTVEKIYQL